jgi:hypothetical protein
VSSGLSLDEHSADSRSHDRKEGDTRIFSRLRGTFFFPRLKRIEYDLHESQTLKFAWEIIAPQQTDMT